MNKLKAKLPVFAVFVSQLPQFVGETQEPSSPETQKRKN